MNPLSAGAVLPVSTEVPKTLLKKEKIRQAAGRRLEKRFYRPHIQEYIHRRSTRVNPVQTSNTVAHPTQIAQDAVMTAYSLTGNLSSATALCRDLLDEDLPAEHQAMAVLVKLHNIAMLRPKH